MELKNYEGDFIDHIKKLMIEHYFSGNTDFLKQKFSIENKEDFTLYGKPVDIEKYVIENKELREIYKMF